MRTHIFLGTVVIAGCAANNFSSEQQALESAGPQFLTLPEHPRDEAGDEEIEFVEAEGRYIWHAPFENGQPPGQTQGNGDSEPGARAPKGGGGGGGGLVTGGDIDVSNTPTAQYEGETSVASNGTVVVGGSNSIFPGACSSSNCAVSAYTSTDGLTWTSQKVSRTFGGTTFGITFDPGIDVDSAGNFYYVFGGAPLSGSFPNGIAVAKSGPDGASFGAPVAVTFNKRRFFDDKYYIAVDRFSSPNRIYVGWDRNVSNNQVLFISRSTDGGATWSAPTKVDDGTTKFERVIGAYPAVDQRNGTVYMSWHNYAKNIIFVDKSTDGGVTWGSDVGAATTHAGFGQDIGCVGGRSQGPAHALKVDSNGVLHLVYADPAQGGGFDILYVRSTNGGANWSAPVRLNDDSGAADQFHPTLALSGTTLTVSFYDRRDDGANCLAHVYATRSTDGGVSWGANIRASSVASNFDGNPNGPGDYSSAAAHGTKVLPLHSDHRSSDYEVFTYPLQ